MLLVSPLYRIIREVAYCNDPISVSGGNVHWLLSLVRKSNYRSFNWWVKAISNAHENNRGENSIRSTIPIHNIINVSAMCRVLIYATDGT